MSQEKHLLDRVIGSDEPAMRLDVAAIEADGARRLRRRRTMVPVAAAAVVVGLIAGGGVLSATFDSPAVDAAGPSPSGAEPSPSSNPAAGQTVVPQVRTVGYCYRTADIADPDLDQHVMIGLSGDSPDGRGDLTGRIMEICRTSWEQNLYDFQQAKPDTQKYPVPELVACVLTDAAVEAQEGAVAVFPGGTTTCENLDLPVARL